MDGYNILMSENDINDNIELYLKKYNKEKNKLRKIIDTNIDSFINNNNRLDAKDMMDNWFPINDYDIFISHSHKDLKYALTVYNNLKDKGYKPFIDSICWGYSNDLLKRIDDIYCYDKKTKTYNYNERNITTSHVHVMLMSSLERIIASCSMVVFVNAKNALSYDGANEALTESPWIYNELLLSKLLITRDKIIKAGVDVQESLKIEYPAEIKHLKEMKYEKFINMLNVRELDDVNNTNFSMLSKISLVK